MTRTTSALLLALLVAVVPVSHATVAAAGHWPPWLIATKTGEHREITGGVAVELMRELARRLELDIQFRTTPWQRSLARMEAGSVDLMPLISRTPERERFMLFTDPVYTDPLVLVASSQQGNESSCDWKNSRRLHGKSVGTVRDYSYGQRWADFVSKQGFRAVTANNDSTNLKKVAGGRLDYSAQYYSHLMTNLANSDLQPDRLKICRQPVESVDLRIGISRHSPLANRVDEINGALRAMKEDGTYQKLLGDLYRQPADMVLTINP